jgi:hypothetical protein
MVISLFVFFSRSQKAWVSDDCSLTFSFQEDGFLFLMYDIQESNNEGLTLSYFVAKVFHDEMISIQQTDVDTIKGMWPVQLLAKVENVHLDLPPRLLKAINAKSTKYFALEKSENFLDKNWTDFSALLAQIRQNLQDKKWFDHYNNLMGAKGD